MVNKLLIGMMIMALSLPIGDFAQDDVNIAIYNGEGASMCSSITKDSLQSLGYAPEYITKDEIVDGELGRFDILVMPGGNAHKQFLGLGEEGISQIRNFVAGGGDYIGICAGSYLAWEVAILPKNYPNPENEVALSIGDINIVNIVNRTDDMEEWEDVAYVETNEGSRAVIFPTEWFTDYEIVYEGEKIDVLYAGGPIFEDEAEVVATYTGNVGKPFSPPEDFRRTMLEGNGAIVTNEYYDGDVVLFSFHPEFKKETHYMLDDAVKYFGGSDQIS